MTPHRYLMFAPQRSDDVANELGRADYSYYFVMRYFAAALGDHDDVLVLDHPDDHPDLDPGALDLRLLFLPPHGCPRDVTGAVPVFAWEYDTIPTDPWGGDDRNDWRTVLGRSAGAITHSRFAAAAVSRAMGPGFAVESAPAPVWDRFARLFDADRVNVDAWSLVFHGVVMDSRSMAGPDGELASPHYEAADHEVAFDGVVYTAVLNPNDGRKNWNDIITAFVFAHRDNPEATLLLKLVHFDAMRVCAPVFSNMSLLAPYRCRIVAIHAYLGDEQYEAMIRGSTYTVNSSRGEGQCLPLMEFMSAGVPALAPDHTAMAEYVTADNAFVIPYSRELTHWPHDPRRFLRCFTYWIDWDALRRAFLASWEVARADQARYREMRLQSVKSLAGYCSGEVTRAAVQRLADRIG